MYRGIHRNWLRPEISLSVIVVGAMLILLGGFSLVANGNLSAYVTTAGACPSDSSSSAASPSTSSAAPSASVDSASPSPSDSAASPSVNASSADASPSASCPTAVPLAPTGVKVTGGYSSIEASWTAPASNGVAITGYRAIASPGPSTCSTYSASDTSCVLGGTPGTAYTVTVVALSAGGGSVASESSGSAEPTAPPVSSTPPDTSLPLDTGDGAISSAAPGQAIVLKGSGYAPYSSVTLLIYSSPTSLGTVQADVNGAFEKSITVPADLATGSHSLVSTGVDADGNVRALRLDITVADDTSGTLPVTLPVTGPAVIWLLVGGFALTLTGFAMRRVQPAKPGSHRWQQPRRNAQ